MTIIERLEAELPSWLLNDFEDGESGGGFVGVCFSFIADVAGHFWTFANRGALLKDRYVAPDVLPKFAWERGMPGYDGETTRQHADRMADAWNAYTYPGRPAIQEQLSYFGFGDSVAIYDAYEWPTEPPVGPKSQFWVVVPEGDHTYRELIIGTGDAVIGDDTFIGIAGITAAQMTAIKALIHKWKPVQWVCREIRFDLGGGSYAAFAVQPYTP
jgi:hypothetical protein